VRILFDQGTPAPLRDCLPGHSIETAHELGWSKLKNGELLSEAEKKFDLLVTTDRHLRFQQNLADSRLAILVLPTTNWPHLRTDAERIATAVNSLKPGQYLELTL